MIQLDTVQSGYTLLDKRLPLSDETRLAVSTEEVALQKESKSECFFFFNFIIILRSCIQYNLAFFALSLVLLTL